MQELKHERSRADNEEDAALALREQVRVLQQGVTLAEREKERAHEEQLRAERQAAECEETAAAADGRVHELSAEIALLKNQCEGWWRRGRR